MRYCQACHRCFGDGIEFCLFDHTPTRGVESLPLVIDGKYRLEQLIAHGGMGSVYRATHLQLERAVAIKILRAEFLADPTVSERFNREARAAARLKHPNIVAVYDFGRLPNGGAYLVMELIEGRSLREEMRTYASRHGQMRPERAAAILSQVCAGIEAAHRQGIIHRDLKPDNVMIEAAIDGTERVLVLDFGIAKLKDRDHPPQCLTDENTVIGTPNYISPEQCTGQQVDARSDVYSLGVILYEMITGRVPFASKNTSAVLLRHLQEPPAPPSRFRTDLSRELEQVILRALAKNPNQRFQSATQFTEHLLSVVRTIHQFVEEEEEVVTRQRAPVAAEHYASEPQTELTTVGLTLRPAQDKLEQPAIRASDEGEVGVRVPTLLVEGRPRTKLYVSVCILTLTVLGAFIYFWSRDWEAKADVVEKTESQGSDVSPSKIETVSLAAKQSASNKNAAAQIAGQASGAELTRTVAESFPHKKSEPGEKVPSPFVPAKNEVSAVGTSDIERAKRELRNVYAEWTTAAVLGDWNKHMNFYADRVDYFRDGLLKRSRIEARKRSTFGRLDSYWLHFSETPQIFLKNSSGEEADLIFVKQWVLRRGKKQIPGKVRGLITLRRDSRGWRIVSERQIKK